MSLNLKDFVKKYPIIFVVPSMNLSVYRYGEYLQTFLDNSNLSNDLPENNTKDILICIPTKNKTFEELHHSNFLKRNYEKFPKTIIVVIGFDNLIDMKNHFKWMFILSDYQIPLLYTSINNERISIDIKLIHLDNYEDSINYMKGIDAVHIIHKTVFNDRLKKLLTTSSSSNYKIFCYYSNTDDLNEWNKIINNYVDITEFYSNIIMSQGKELYVENDGLYIK